LAEALTAGGTPPDPTGEAVPVRLHRVRGERGRPFGDVWRGWLLGRARQFDALLEQWLPPGRAAVPWATRAAIVVLARLCAPARELLPAETGSRHTALEDLVSVPAERGNDDRCSRALAPLLPHKTTLEQHLVRRRGERFPLDCALRLCAVTSPDFEGQANADPWAQRGYRRAPRPDGKQVGLALVGTREGMPRGGTRSSPATGRTSRPWKRSSALGRRGSGSRSGSGVWTAAW
jgi:hypothetical protein